MNPLFTPMTINGMTLANRFVRSATWEGMAGPDGCVTQRLIDCMAALADGGVGLIITGHAFVALEGKASPWQLGIHDDAFLPGLQKMVNEVHVRGGRIVAQLAHAGRRALQEESGLPPRMISATGTEAPPVTEMGPCDFKTVAKKFSDAASRAKKTGFDGVQIHSAHGYLLSQSLSPLENRRSDWYGGSVTHRMRFLLEVYTAIRETVGASYPVLIKLNSSDHLDGGFTIDEACAVAIRLAHEGIDAIEVSGGTPESGALSPIRTRINTPEKEAYFREAGKVIKESVQVPVMLVGGIRSLETAVTLHAEGRADLISLSRPLIREPNLIARWHQGDTTPAACTSCCRCFVPGRRGDGIRCMARVKKS
ncbi:NADH:flavin oxidoreductase [Desulfoluna sp.]|uniref:NADH:flavin oxidoreductase n=1 Tax=Desulfoluna sp. TaxID=2045199 RepID=UPI00260D3996|nr:NADH:flavin oxidoreductase [Desulfoluna sp.]